MCAAPIGNRFWEARSSHGRKPKFKDADVLWSACCEYFKWAEDNPLWENKVTQYQGVPVDMPVAKMRAMTLSGMCLFLDIDKTTWENYRVKDDFFRVTSNAEQIIYNQKFAGASADLLNANIIARDLGLVDKQEKNIKGNLQLTDMTSDELERKKQELENELAESLRD
ncbi:MAG: DNA-packaging protein [Gammaproteobacteria bacterium]|nr:DNA-packaging protein [Gammaproteobacteria bacterium]